MRNLKFLECYRLEEMNWGDIITRAGAAVGTALGIFNAWQTSRLHKVNIRTVPTAVKRWLRSEGQGRTGNPNLGYFLVPGVEVINLSAFPITINEVGYEVTGGSSYPLSELDAPVRWTPAADATIPIVDKLPQRLDPRASLRMVWSQADEPNLKGKTLRRTYAKTVCGTTARGRSAMLRELRAKVNRGIEVIERIEDAR
jgi:hypothetical protein